MNSVERVKLMCKERKIPISKLEKDLEFSNGYIGQLRKGVFPDDRLYKIADYFGVSADYIATGNETLETIVTCKECGFSYVTTDIDDVKEHIRIHDAWKKATEKFGTLYCNSAENEKIKGENRSIRNNMNNSIDIRYNAEINVLRCLFSDEVFKADFSLDHVSFEDFVAMKMNEKEYIKHLDTELRKKIIENFGVNKNRIETKEKSEIDIIDIIKNKYGERESKMFQMYLQLDEFDKGQIMGEMKILLQAEKYKKASAEQQMAI